MPEVFRRAARQVGVPVCSLNEAHLAIIAQDMPTNPDGSRDPTAIEQLIYFTRREWSGPILLTSQVTPGFTRKFKDWNLYCQAETLRNRDAFERALYPEQHIIGTWNGNDPLPIALHRWLEKFPAPIHKMTYEEAEYAKIAINVCLAHQVALANSLAHRAREFGCDWEQVKKVLQHDRRIGRHAYLDPGDWTQSAHLLRDYKTFHEIPVIDETRPEDRANAAE